MPCKRPQRGIQRCRDAPGRGNLFQEPIPARPHGLPHSGASPEPSLLASRHRCPVASGGSSSIHRPAWLWPFRATPSVLVGVKKLTGAAHLTARQGLGEAVLRDQRVMRNYQGPHRGSTMALDWAVWSARMPIIGQLGRAICRPWTGMVLLQRLAFVATQVPCSSPENRLLFMQLPMGTGPDKTVLCCNCERSDRSTVYGHECSQLLCPVPESIKRGC